VVEIVVMTFRRAPRARNKRRIMVGEMKGIMSKKGAIFKAEDK